MNNKNSKLTILNEALILLERDEIVFYEKIKNIPSQLEWKKRFYSKFSKLKKSNKEIVDKAYNLFKKKNLCGTHAYEKAHLNEKEYLCVQHFRAAPLLILVFKQAKDRKDNKYAKRLAEMFIDIYKRIIKETYKKLNKIIDQKLTYEQMSKNFFEPNKEKYQNYMIPNINQQNCCQTLTNEVNFYCFLYLSNKILHNEKFSTDNLYELTVLASLLLVSSNLINENPFPKGKPVLEEEKKCAPFLAMLFAFLQSQRPNSNNYLKKLKQTVTNFFNELQNQCMMN
jgi:hypothetical protein